MTKRQRLGFSLLIVACAGAILSELWGHPWLSVFSYAVALLLVLAIYVAE